MKLPELPKKNKDLEAKFGMKLREWIMKNPRVPCTFETKDTRGKDYLNFSEVKDVQINFGMAIKSKKGVLIRLFPFVEGTPDYGYFSNSPAYIVIKYPKQFSLVDVETFQIESKRSKRRSLTSARARDISVITVQL